MVVFIGYFYNDVLQRYQCYSAALGPPAANPSLLHTCAAFMKTEVVPTYLYHLIPSIRSHKLKMLWKQKFILDKKKNLPIKFLLAKEILFYCLNHLEE